MKLLKKIKKYSPLLIIILVFATSCKNETKKEDIKTIETSRVDYLPYYEDESFTPNWITPGTKEEHAFHKIPDFKLVNQLGDTISQDTFDNKIYVTDFFFTICPGICPQLAESMLKVQDAFINDPEILLLSHSVMPTTDSVPVLNAYAKSHGVITNKWHLVTGDKKEIYDLGRTQYFVENDLGTPKNLDDFLHTENFLLIDKNKHIRGIYNGLNRASVAQLITDIKALKTE